MKRVVLQVKGNMHWGRKKHLDSDMANTCAHMYKVKIPNKTMCKERRKQLLLFNRAVRILKTLSNFYLIFGTMQRGAQ